MANIALIAWGVKFLAAVGSYNSAVSNYNGGQRRNPFDFDSKAAGVRLYAARDNLLSLRVELVLILSTENPATSSEILTSLDAVLKPITDFKLGKQYSAPSGSIIALKTWYDKYIKPLI